MKSHRFLLESTAIAAMVLALTAATAGATTYNLGAVDYEGNIGSAESPWNWGTALNWNPEGVPGASDTITWAPNKTSSHRHAYLSLDGDYTVGTLEQNYRTLHLYKDPNTVAETVSLTFATQLGGNGYQNSHELSAGVKLVVPASATYNCSPSDHAFSGMDIKSGAEADIYGSILSRVMKLDVNGGTLVFAPASYAVHGWGRSQTDHDEINIASGSASFPNGIAMTGTFTEPNQVNQSGGTATFGGDFTSQMAWTYTWSSGTLAITDDSTFGANVALVIPASASVSLDIASGKTFAAPGLSADSTASITVTGGGTFSIAPTTAPIILQNGSLGLATAGTYDLSNVSVGSGAATITLTAFGATINSLPSALASATFIADLSSAAAGTVILNSSDSAVLSKVQTDLASSVPAGMSLAVSGSSLSLEAQSAYAFRTTGDLLGTTGWGGAVPPAGVEVSVEGSGVVATYASGAIPAWTSITVKDGATLRVAANATLPPVILNKSATLEIDNNATMTLANAADLSGIATATQVPVLSIASGATLNVPGGMKFSNVNIALAGTVAATSQGDITFGYAETGAETYIGFIANGGTVSLYVSGWDYDLSVLKFCCPESGGVVHAIGELAFINADILPVYTSDSVTYPFTEAYQCGFHLGVNNPTTSPFAVVFDNTKWGVSGKTKILGAATFLLRNGGSYMNYETHTLWNRTAEISEKGRVVVGSGCEFRLNAMGDWGTQPLMVTPSDANYESIVIEDGGVFESYRTSGNNKAALSVSNGVYQVYVPWITNSEFEVKSANLPFEGLASVNVAANSALTFSTRNRVFWNSGQFHDGSGDRVVALANVPITGGGSIAVSNANANVFGIVVQSGSNTATGTASVVPPTGAGIGATTLYFANGANWAGTVVATNGLVKLVTNVAAATNSVAEPAPVEVTFGGIEMQEDFALRLWQNGTCDCINIGANGWSGNGKLDFEFVDFAEAGAQAWKIATQPANTALPAVKKASFSLFTQPSETAGREDVVLKVANGIVILLR